MGELFDPAGCAAHATQACHAVVIRRTGWNDGFDRAEVCADPRRHNTSRVGTEAGSDLASDRTPMRPRRGDDGHAKRAGRLARLAHATETLARQRGRFSQVDLTPLALRGLIFDPGRDALVFAATMLGHDQPRDITVERLLDGIDSASGLVRVAGAVALA